MSTWSISEAKAKLSEVVRRSRNEPQTITVHGVAKADVVSIDEYLRRGGKMADLEQKNAKSGRR
ncbi:MAG TPA: type II toxin-antitoxin system Phd/YefM family antitoxin [Rhizomicrobium sp.]|jgi:prevent-host-death family protein